MEYCIKILRSTPATPRHSYIIQTLNVYKKTKSVKYYAEKYEIQNNH